MPENYQAPPPLPPVNMGRDAMPWAREMERRLKDAEATIARLLQNGGTLGKTQSGIATRLEQISSDPIPFPYNYPWDAAIDAKYSWLLTRQPRAGDPNPDPSTADGDGALGIGFVHADGASSIAIAAGGSDFAYALGEGSIGIGSGAEANADDTTVVGTFSSTGNEEGGTVYGAFADAYRESATSIGHFSTADEFQGIGIGRSAHAYAPLAIAQGAYTDAQAVRALALGADASARAPLAQVFGAGRTFKLERSVIATRELEIVPNDHGDEQDYFGRNVGDYSSSVILYSPSGDGWKVSVDNAGVLSAVAMPIETADSFWPAIPATVGNEYSWMETNSDGSIIVAILSAYPDYLSMSTDGGATWNPLTAAGSRRWQRVVISDDGVTMLAGAASGSSGSYAYTFYSSTDSGASWTSHSPGIAGSPTSFPSWAFDGSADLSIVTASYLGLIFTTDDLGATWTAAPEIFPYGGNVGVSVSADGTVHYVVLHGGYVAVSTDSGVTWALSATILNDIRPGIRFSTFLGAYKPIATSADGSLVVVGMDGPLLYSEDFGETWDEIPDSGSHEWISVSVSDDGAWIIAGSFFYSGLYVGDTSGIGYVDYTASEYYWLTAISGDGVMMYATSLNTGSTMGILSFDTTTL